MPLSWILRWNTDGIEVEQISVRFRVPQDDFIPTREAPPIVEAMSEMPNDSVAKLQPVLLENIGKLYVERHDLPIIDIIPHLPAQRSGLTNSRDNLIEDALLPTKVFIELRASLVGFAYVVRGRGNYKIESLL